DGQRIDRAGDGRVADAARRGHALPQPDDAGERIDHAEAVAGGTRDQEPAIVGAEIERGIGRTGTARSGLRALMTGVPVGRTPTPTGPRPRRPLMVRVEAAGFPAL